MHGAALNRAGALPVHSSMALTPPSRHAVTERSPGLRVRPALWIALGLSIAIHLAWSLWPVEMPTEVEDRPLTATLTELPPPPAPAAAPVAKPKPKPRRAPRPVPPPVAEPSPAEPPAPEAAVADAAAPASTPEPVAAAPAEPPAPPAPPAPPTPDKTLPPRVDLAYKVFLGTQGFLIGEATYRFEHEGDRYRIATVAEARGLAALFIRGRGKIESRGLITPTGLRPLEFVVERGSSDRREVATFDWDANIVTLHDDKTAPLEAPSFDPMTLMWQPYFTPPTAPRETLYLVTTRRVFNYTIEREGTETITWTHGDIETERWHRKSEDGNVDAWFWLAPSMHYAMVKMRVTQSARGTVEALLDAIRVDEPRNE